MKLWRIVFIPLAILCIVYATFIYAVGSGTFSFVIWIAGAVFFGLCFFLSGKDRWRKVPVPLRRICYGVIALGIAVFIICQFAMISHFDDEGPENLDYIVVLGAQMKANGPSTVYKFRLDAAYDYLTENPDTVCIVSGGKGAIEPVNEGDGGREYLLSRGIEPERVIAENDAMDTPANVANSLKIMRESFPDDEGLRFGVVTNNFHVFRGIHLAKKLTTAEVYGISAPVAPLYLPNNLVRECFGIIRDLPKMRM